MKHCWHQTGMGMTMGDGRSGSDDFRCCHCGAPATRVWSLTQWALPGHGKFASKDKRSIGEIVTHESVVCPERRGEATS